MDQWSSEAAGVGPEVGPAPVPAAAAGMGEAEVPGPRSRPRRSSGSGCEVEAAVAEAEGRKEGEGRGRSLLARLLMGCPAGAGGAQRRAGPEPGEGVVTVGGGRKRWGGRGEVQHAKMESHRNVGSGNKVKIEERNKGRRWRGE